MAIYDKERCHHCFDQCFFVYEIIMRIWNVFSDVDTCALQNSIKHSSPGWCFRNQYPAGNCWKRCFFRRIPAVSTSENNGNGRKIPWNMEAVFRPESPSFSTVSIPNFTGIMQYPIFSKTPHAAFLIHFLKNPKCIL